MLVTSDISVCHVKWNLCKIEKEKKKTFDAKFLENS